jgi:NAD(P) transhydrogenase subunit alpha
VKEEVESLGAKFVQIEMEQEGEGGGSGQYAKELSEDQQRRQRELLAQRVAAADCVITTAAVPGRPAPKLITAEMAQAMRPGSVIVDIAAETGGNCELTEPGSVVVRDGVTIDGTLNLPSPLTCCSTCRAKVASSSISRTRSSPAAASRMMGGSSMTGSEKRSKVP